MLFFSTYLVPLLVAFGSRWQGQWFGPLNADGVKLRGINSQGLENRRGNLRCRYRRFDNLGIEFRVRDDEPDVRVRVVEATVFGILGLRRGVNRAVIRSNNQIRSAAVAYRVLELERQFGAGHDFVDEQFFGVGVEVVRRGRREALLAGRQPNQSDVVIIYEPARAGIAIVARIVDHDPDRVAIVECEYQVVGSSRVDLQACKLEYSIVSPK